MLFRFDYLYSNYDEWYQIDSTLICDYCIIPEADYILKEDTSFLNESISAGVKC